MRDDARRPELGLTGYQLQPREVELGHDRVASPGR